MAGDTTTGSITKQKDWLYLMLAPMAGSILVAAMGPTAFLVLNAASMLRVLIIAHADKSPILRRIACILKVHDSARVGTLPRAGRVSVCVAKPTKLSTRAMLKIARSRPVITRFTQPC